jgi:hypothetical protein
MKTLADVSNFFFADKERNTLLIKGKWGIGKTYSWNDFISKHSDLNFKAYSYVSCFGLRNIEDLRKNTIENAFRIETRKVSTNHILSSLLVKYQKILVRFRPNVEKISSNTGAALGFAENLYNYYLSSTGVMNEWLICFDDLERKSSDLSLISILGLADKLVQKQNCKLVFICNEEQFDSLTSQELNKFREKCIDSSFEFLAEESKNAKVAIPDEEQRQFIFSTLHQLTFMPKNSFLNIRILRKIRWNINDLLNEIKIPNRTIENDFKRHVIIYTYFMKVQKQN